MAYIIDGHNLIGVLPDISLSQPDDEARLIARLLSYRAQGASQMIVFFDGNPLSVATDPGHHPRSIPSWPGMAVHYAPPGKSADDAIVDFVRGSRQPGQYAVVTNDQGLTARVRNLGASTLPASEFSSRMARRKPKRRTPASLATAPAPNPRDPAFADLYDEFLAAERARELLPQNSPADTATWIERLYTGDPQLQQLAAKVLGQSRNPDAVAPLCDALTHADASIRAEAALALGILRDESAAPALASLLSADSNSMVREAAAQALGAIGSPKSIPALEMAAGDDTKNKVRKAARAALEAIRARR
jgi:predicted RNA-binding protein with PIN domain